MLREDIARARQWARNDCLTFDKQPATIQFVLTSLAFQCGQTGLAQFRRFLAAINAGSYLAAGECLRQSRIYWQCNERIEGLARLVEHCE